MWIADNRDYHSGVLQHRMRTLRVVLRRAGLYRLYATGFHRFYENCTGPAFWIGVTLILSLSSLIPGLSTNAAVLIATLWLDRPPTGADSFLVNTIAYITLGAVVLPILIGGKVYNTLQFVMSVKVFTVLGFCLFLGVFFVGLDGWIDVFSGFLKFGNMPTTDVDGKDTVTNSLTHFWSTGTLPVLALGISQCSERSLDTPVVVD